MKQLPNLIYLFLMVPAVSLNAFSLFANLSNGSTLNLNVNPSDTSEAVQQKVQDQVGVPPDLQTVFFDEQVVEEGHTLASYNIQKEASIEVQVAPRSFEIGSTTWTSEDRLDVQMIDFNGFLEVSRYPVTGTLDVSGISAASPLTVRLSTPMGPVGRFDAERAGSWIVLEDTAGTIEPLDPAAFVIDTSGFGNAFDGSFDFSEGSLVLDYTPVPEPASTGLFIALFAGLLATSRQAPGRVRRLLRSDAHPSVSWGTSASRNVSSCRGYHLRD